MPKRVKRVKCPACRSEISDDGKTLFERSDYLADMEKSVAKLPELKAALAKLESRPAPKPKPKPEGKDDVAVRQKGSTEGRKAYWEK